MTIIDGDRFENVLLGTSEADTIDGKGGRDWISGRNGDDTLTGGFGDDYILGGNGNDKIVGYGFDASTATVSRDLDYIDGGNGDDDIMGSNGSDMLYGGNGNDRIEGELLSPVGGGDGDRLYGGKGDDTIRPRWGDDLADGGPGDDTIDLITPRRGAPPQNPDGQDTVQFSFNGADGGGLGHDQVLFLLTEDRLLFNDLKHGDRIDTLDELMSVTTFRDTGLNTYQLDWNNNKASISIQVEPMQFGEAPDAFDKLTSFKEFSTFFHVDFT